MMDFLKKRCQSFVYAWDGIRDILLTEHNAWIHFFCSLSVLILSFWLKLPTVDFVLIIFVIVLVWIAEAFNTVLEIVIDIVSPQYNRAAKRAKDIAAAAVLFASIGAFLIGLIILGPPLLMKFAHS